MQGGGRSPPPSMNVCVPLACRSAEYGTASLSLCFRDSLLVLVRGLVFQSPGRALPARPLLLLGQGSFPLCLPLGLACASLRLLLSSSLLAVAFFPPGPQRHSCFPWAEGNGRGRHFICQHNARAACFSHQV